MQDARDRVLAAVALAVRRRCEGVEGAEVLERDGLVLSLTNLPEPSLNAAYVERDPPDPDRALAWAEDEMTRRGHGFGLEIPAGRFPALERAVRDAGLERLLLRPMMVAEVPAMPEAAPPSGVEIRPVRGRAEALALARVDSIAFGTRLEISERAFAAGVVGIQGARGFVAWSGKEPVGSALAQDGAGATGVFGVAVVPEARRRGIGAALTVAAVRAFPADLAWLMPTDMARAMYERLGFRGLETWEVWIRPA